MAKKQLKKEWYPVIAPKLFRNAVLGETHVFDPQDMIGKGMSVNLMTLTNSARNQNVKVNFEVKKVADNKGQTELTGYKLVNSSIKRMVRRNVEKIDDSFTCTTSDNVTLRIKPIIIARRTTSGSVATAIRKAAQQAIASQAKGMKFDAFAQEVVFHKVQEGLKKKLSKVYPVKLCEFKYMGIEAASKVAKSDSKEESEEVAKEPTQAPAEEAKKEAPKTEEASE